MERQPAILLAGAPVTICRYMSLTGDRSMRRRAWHVMRSICFDRTPMWLSLTLLVRQTHLSAILPNGASGSLAGRVRWLEPAALLVRVLCQRANDGLTTGGEPIRRVGIHRAQLPVDPGDEIAQRVAGQRTVVDVPELRTRAEKSARRYCTLISAANSTRSKTGAARAPTAATGAARAPTIAAARSIRAVAAPVPWAAVAAVADRIVAARPAQAAARCYRRARPSTTARGSGHRSA
jgi:hypothetical protein